MIVEKIFKDHEYFLFCTVYNHEIKNKQGTPGFNVRGIIREYYVTASKEVIDRHFFFNQHQWEGVRLMMSLKGYVSGLFYFSAFSNHLLFNLPKDFLANNSPSDITSRSTEK